MGELWKVNQTVVEIQRGGPGNPILLLDPSATVTGPSGGGQTVADRWTRDFKRGAGAYKRAGVYKDSAPERFTFDLMTNLQVKDFLEKLTRMSCEHILRVRYHCGNVEDVANYSSILAYTESFGTGYNYDNNVANGTEPIDVPLMTVVNESASEEVRIPKIQHLKISGSVSDFALNDVISVGVEQCAGDCGGENDGNQDYWAVGDVDTTPGYGGTGAPNFYYTENGGTSWTSKAIDVALSANAFRVYKIGGYVFATLGASGVAYARFQDIKDGVSNPWALATGLSGLTVNALAYAGGTDVYAACNGGNIYKSTDGGFTFSVLSAGTVTAQNLNDVQFVSNTLGWFVGNSGAIVKYFNGALSLVAVSGLTANIGTAAVQVDRPKELYLGTTTGLVYRTRDVGVTWASMAFIGSGTGQVNKLIFGGPKGIHLFVLQRNVAGTKSRLLRDLSGGALGYNVEIVGSYDSPANSIINSFAPSDANTGISVGEIDGGAAFIGRVIGVAL